MGRKGHGDCCDPESLIKCICGIDKELACLKDCGFKHVSRSTREKALFCLILRDIAKLEKKLDKILRELNSDWDCDSESHSDSDSDSFCDSDSDSHCHPHPHKPCKI